MKAKKLLAILLSLALLVGLMPAAGLVLGGAAETVDLSEKVIKVDFTAGAGDDAVDSSKWCLSVYNLNSPEVKDDTDFKTDAQTNGAYYTFSFDYYLESATYVDADLDTSSSTSLDWPGGYCNYVSGDKVLQPGYHSFTLTEVRTNTNGNMQTLPSFQNIAEDAVLYVWNLKVTLNGRQITAQSAASGVKDVYYYSANTTYTTASITNDKTLEDYDWAFLPNADGSVKKTAVYVDSVNGVDTNDGSATDKAVKTLSKALNLIEASQYLAADIYIVGTYTTTNQYDMASDGTSATRFTTNWTKPVTIQSAPDTAATLKSAKSQLWVCGPTTFDNIAITHTTTALAIIAREKDVVFTDSVTMGTSLSSGTSMAPTLTTGDYGMANVTDTEQEPMTVTLNGGNYFNVQLGDSCSSTHTSYLKYDNNLYFGVNYTQNAGSVYKLLIGGVGNSSTGSGGNAGYYVNRRGTSYQGDVNVVVNGGTVTGIYIEDDANVQNGCTTRAEADITPNKWLSNLNGHAVQIILNNGVTAATLPTAQNAIDMGGSLYLLQCATGGSQLAPTDTAGTYTVANPSWTAIATGTDAEGNAVERRSANGTLTVPAGTYTVTWEAPEVYSVYVDDEGSDDNVGVSADAPYKTLEKAIKEIGNSGAKSGVINVVDTLTVTEAFAMTNQLYTNGNKSIVCMAQKHAMPITIQGANGTESTLVLSEIVSDYDLYTYGDLTIDNITAITPASYTIFTNKFNFKIGPGAVFSNPLNVYLGHFNTQNNRVNYGMVVPTEETEPVKMTLDAGVYGTVGLGSRLTHYQNYDKARLMPGINFVLNGGTIDMLRVGHYGDIRSNGTAVYGIANSYLGNINITVNGGSINELVLGDQYPVHTEPTDLNGNALQLILNNGAVLPTVQSATSLEDTTSLAATVESMNGYLYMMQCDEGISLTVTETEGVYNIESDYDKLYAVNVKTDERIEVTDGVLTVNKPGIYTVTSNTDTKIVTHAAQIREDGAIRFVSTVDRIGASRNDAYVDGVNANYSEAKITVDGVEYPVITAGTIFARGKKLADNELLYGADNVYDIPAMKFQNPDNAPDNYKVSKGDGDIFFTGVITNVPEANRGETLVARAYVAYEKDGVTTYAYGNTIRRTWERVIGLEDAPAADGTLKVLALGNSFSQDALAHLHDICIGSGFQEEDLVLANLYIGGCSLEKHSLNVDAERAELANETEPAVGAYTYEVYVEGGWNQTEEHTIYQALMKEDWDVITIQQSSAYSGVSSSYTGDGEVSYLENVLSYLEQYEPDARIMWHMTWAYQSDYVSGNFDRYNADQMTMYNGILGAVEDNIFPLVDEGRISGVIPSGTAIQNLRTSYLGDTLTRDGFHMSFDRGRYTVGLTWYCMLTGYNASTATALPKKYPGLEMDLAVIREAVDNALAEPYKVVDSTYPAF